MSKHRPTEFLSTLPAWGATLVSRKAGRAPKFLSTLPAWGATVSQNPTHARDNNFYPRSPRGERPAVPEPPLNRGWISIHAPRVGSDTCVIGADTRYQISIHAPRVGSDMDGGAD